MESQAVNKSNGNEDYANWKNADENSQDSENERTSERARDREKIEMNKVSREICFGFFFLS